MPSPRFTRGQRPVGRARGTPNKTTVLLRDLILRALDQAGGVEYLRRQADQNPAAFMALLGKILPTQIGQAAELDAVNITVIERHIVAPPNTHQQR